MNARWALVAILLLPGVATAQQQKKPERLSTEEQYRRQVLQRAEQEYREFYKRPETVPEYWAAIKYEIEVGRVGLAAHLIHGLVGLTKDEAGRKALLDLEEEDGLTAFLRLRVVPNWVDDPNLPPATRENLNRQARADVEELIARVTAAVQKFLANPVRIGKMIQLLSGSEDEYRYGLAQLRRSGAVAVPYLSDALLRAADAHTRQTILDTLVALDRAAVPPMLAALDTEDATLRMELIDVLQRRYERDAVPWLWYPSATGPEGARRKAAEALVQLLNTSPEKLPPAKAALTREAERYYEHQVPFPAGQEVTVWQWENGRLHPQAMTPGEAEEYFALRFARQALDLDPTYEPAQVVFLSTALAKGAERSGLGRTPAVQDLLKVVNPGLVIAVLERAMREHRLPVILGAVWALGDLGELQAARPAGKQPPVLVRALNYPDRRVQLAAADALLRLPGAPAYEARARLVEVLRRALAASPRPLVLIGDADAERGNAIGHAVQKAGYDAVVVQSGRDVLRRLREAGDVDAVLVDSALPNPELPYLLAQLRADVDAGRLPVLVTVSRLPSGAVDEDREKAVRRLAERYPNVWVMSATVSPRTLQETLAARVADTEGKLMSPEERRANASLALVWLKRMATGELPGYDVRPAEGAILDALGANDLAPLAAEAATRLPGRDVQRRLAQVLLNATRPPAVRAAAATALGRHIEQFGLVLRPEQIQGIDTLYQSLAAPGKESPLRAAVALVLGSMHPDPARTGRRLQQYTPPRPAPAPAKEPADSGQEDKPEPDRP